MNKHSYIKLVFIILILLIGGNPCFAAKYEIKDYEGTSDSLKNHVPAFVSGDVLELENDLTATSNLDNLGEITVTLNGNNYTVSGDGKYSGLIVNGVNSKYSVNHVNFSEFVKNTTADVSMGSVIYNSNGASLTILNSSFKDNKISSADNFAFGGVIYNDGIAAATALNITNSEFFGNLSETGINQRDSASGGGVIFSQGNTRVCIKDSTFKNNTARALVYSYGGVISNYGNNTYSNSIEINNSVFDGNSSISQNNTGYGGAIYNNAQTERSSVINDSTFTNNLAQGSFGRGGAIYNASLGSISINNSIFEGNTVVGVNNSSGGAFDNRSSKTTILRNSMIVNNSVIADRSPEGGGIYNSGVLNLIADDGITKISGNTTGNWTNRISNGIVNIKTIHINASTSGIISIEDKVKSSGTYLSTININQVGVNGNTTPIVDAPTKGNVVFLETIENQTINVYDGMMSLGRMGKNIVADGNYFSGVNLNLYGGTFNIANENIDNINLKNLSSTSAAYLYLDADLNAGLIDNFTVTNTPTGNLTIVGINILDDSDVNKTLTIFNGASPNLDNLNLNVYTQNNKYEVKSTSAGKLDFNVTANTSGMTGAISDSITQFRSFSAAADENITVGLGTLGGANAKVTIFGNLQNINGNRKSGMQVLDGQSLRIFSAGSTDSTGAIVNAVNGFVKAGSSSDIIGGFLDNNGTADIFSSAFLYNQVVSANVSYAAKGGAVSNTKDISLSFTAFEKNIAQGEGLASGGALYSSGNASVNTATFKENKAVSATGEARGGAITNEGEMCLVNTSFYDNAVEGATAKGGAIYNSGILHIITAFSDIEFSGNTANGISNAIFNEGTLNLNIGHGNKIVFNDIIEGKDLNSSKININYADDVSVAAPTSGEVIFNDKVKDSTLSLYSGTLSVSKESNLNGNNMNFNGGFLNYLNGEIGTTAFKNVTLNGETRWGIDVDLANQTADKITAESVGTSSGVINISSINLISDAVSSSSVISVVSDNLKNNVNLSVTKAITPIYQYRLSYDNSDGTIKIGGGPYVPPGPGPQPVPPYQNFNPAIMAAPVAAQIGSYLTQLNSYDEAFNNMDMYMLLPRAQRTALKFRNKRADASNPSGIFSPIMTTQDKESVWFKPYSTFENVPLRNGPRVKNIAYGSFFGADSDLKDLGHGFDGVFTLYAGYNGSHQTYDGIGIYQNGGVGGATAVVYKGNFYSGLTANVGANSGDASTMYGRDSFTMLTAGVASKSGYNWELFDNKLVIQPNYLMSYTFVNTFDFNNSAGVRVTSSPLNAIQISPGIRIIGNLKNGWQPYLGVNMVWNIIDETRFKANDVSLPELSVKPFVEYGLGIQKRHGERFTGFTQAMVRSGGRNGVALMMGFRFSI